jgi:hypothetical protein
MLCLMDKTHVNVATLLFDMIQDSAIDSNPIAIDIDAQLADPDIEAVLNSLIDPTLPD